MIKAEPKKSFEIMGADVKQTGEALREQRGDPALAGLCCEREVLLRPADARNQQGGCQSADASCGIIKTMPDMTKLCRDVVRPPAGALVTLEFGHRCRDLGGDERRAASGSHCAPVRDRLLSFRPRTPLRRSMVFLIGEHGRPSRIGTAAPGLVDVGAGRVVACDVQPGSPAPAAATVSRGLGRADSPSSTTSRPAAPREELDAGLPPG